MLVSSIGYFNKSSSTVLNSAESSSKKHPVVNEGLKEDIVTSDGQNVIVEIFNNLKSAFSKRNNDCSKSLNMIA